MKYKSYDEFVKIELFDKLCAVYADFIKLSYKGRNPIMLQFSPKETAHFEAMISGRAYEFVANVMVSLLLSDPDNRDKTHRDTHIQCLNGMINLHREMAIDKLDTILNIQTH